MANQGELQFILPKTDDLTAYELVKRIAEHFGIAEPISIRIAHAIQADITVYGEANILPAEYKLSELAISGESAKAGQPVSFKFARFETGKPEFRIDPRRDYATLQVSGDLNYWRSNPALMIEASAIISRNAISSIGAGSDEDKELFHRLIVEHDTIHRRMLGDLNSALTEMVARRAEMEQEAAASDEIRRQAHEIARMDLEEQRSSLERQSHMATRRKIGQSIHKIMSGEGGFARSGWSSTFALLVFLAYFFLGLAGGISTYLNYMSIDSSLVMAFSLDMSNGEDPNNPIEEGIIEEASAMTPIAWFLMLKMLLSSAVTIFGFVSAATWMRRHLDDENRFAEEKASFVADVERASWVIEAIHEVKHEAKGELPKEWVDAVTRNLFAPRIAASDLDEGAQALRALIGLAGSAKVGPQGLEMEFNKKGTKALGEA